MERKIKLIWDFRGPMAEKTAEHHCLHLRQYCSSEGLDAALCGAQNPGVAYSIAYLVVPESRMISVRDALRPHRGEVFPEPMERKDTKD
ncbi:MAG: hypothetical protein AAGA86_12600 [Bacteroidota bacterium]